MLEALEEFGRELDDNSPPLVLSEYSRSVPTRMYFKRLFITRQGHVGLGPAAARPGDRISLLYKTSCPMVLYPQDGFYRVVDGSYLAALTRPKIEGTSHLLDALTSGAIEPEMIEIR
jgi:hypothetical protein